MKKLYISILLILSLTACTDDPCLAEEEAATEKPVIYLYPDEDMDEKPVVYLYPPEHTENAKEEKEPCPDEWEVSEEKPVIYLRPENTTEVSVKLDYNGKLTSTYPAYNDGWNVLASPDGTLIDPLTGREYYCLFWEGVTDAVYDFSTGFCVAGEDTAAFLEETLAELGLNEREANEFIIYWLPRMETNPYNLIAFQTDAYTDNAVLTVEPAPDCMIRVFMAWKPSAEPVEIEPQQLAAEYDRSGFTVVEWGGTEVHGKES